jgi:hypothetical protein
MSHSHQFLLDDRRLSTDTLVNLLVDKCGYKLTSKSGDSHINTLTADGAVALVLDSPDEYGNTLYKKLTGVLPTIEIGFIPAKFDEYGVGVVNIAQAIGQVLRETSCDLVWLISIDTCVLRRIAGQLTLYTHLRYWSDRGSQRCFR